MKRECKKRECKKEKILILYIVKTGIFFSFSCKVPILVIHSSLVVLALDNFSILQINT